MIRKARVEDLKFINNLGKEYTENFEKTYDIKSYIQNDKYIILVNEDECVNSFLVVYKNIDCFELEMIVVSKYFRSKKIASNLLEYFFDNYCQKGNIVFLEVSEKNDPALNLYKKYNFNLINIRKKYYKDSDAYVMKKVI